MSLQQENVHNAGMLAFRFSRTHLKYLLISVDVGILFWVFIGYIKLLMYNVNDKACGQLAR